MRVASKMQTTTVSTVAREHYPEHGFLPVGACLGVASGRRFGRPRGQRVWMSSWVLEMVAIERVFIWLNAFQKTVMMFSASLLLCLAVAPSAPFAPLFGALLCLAFAPIRAFRALVWGVRAAT